MGRTGLQGVVKGLLEEAAAVIVSRIKDIKSESRRRATLIAFFRSYGDTAAGAEAKMLLEKLGIETRRPSRRRRRSSP